jgi:hypothetical protein
MSLQERRALASLFKRNEQNRGDAKSHQHTGTAHQLRVGIDRSTATDACSKAVNSFDFNREADCWQTPFHLKNT